MKIVVVLCLCIAAACGAPTPAETTARRALPAIHHEEIHDDFGQYALRYVTAEGITYEERGRLVPDPDGKDYVLVYEGEYSFIGEDGVTYKTKYTADIEGGLKVEGDHLPKAPEFEEVKEETKEPEASSSTEMPKSTEETKAETGEAHKDLDVPMEQHDEQVPRYPAASA